ncbi:hypothetical protein J6590_029999 [Homalodisca vitripennis]|nr:hypothetical protein J6590_029999 [Homalodisca vitripennis]
MAHQRRRESGPGLETWHEGLKYLYVATTLSSPLSPQGLGRSSLDNRWPIREEEKVIQDWRPGKLSRIRVFINNRLGGMPLDQHNQWSHIVASSSSDIAILAHSLLVQCRKRKASSAVPCGCGYKVQYICGLY